MAKTLRFNRRVPDDIRKACDWYAKLSPAVVRRFQESIDETLDRIAASPHMMALLFEDLELRAWKVPAFPYVILYRTNGAVVVIEAMRHAASDSAAWRTPSSSE